MQASFSVADGRAVIRLQGRFDFNAHREFREATEQALREAGAKELRVDLAEVEYLDSSALGMLLMLRDKLTGAGKEVGLGNVRGTVKQVLDIANFGKLFRIS